MVNIGKLNWKKVTTHDGVTIGEVQGGQVDPSNWQVTHFHVGLNDQAAKEFGLHKPFAGQLLICLPVQYVEKVDDAVILNKSLEDLKGIKECQEFKTS